MICGSATEKMRTSDFRRRTSAGLRGRCMRRACGGRIVRSLKSEVGSRLSGSEQGAGGVGGLLSVSCDGKFYVPIYGGNGNIMGYVDESGTLVAKFVYDPYGNVVSISDDIGNSAYAGLRGEDFPFGFSTKYHDREVDLIAYQLRSYSPALGRWLNRDPIEEEGGVNIFVFCRNNPLITYDKNGEAYFAYRPLDSFLFRHFVIGNRQDDIDNTVIAHEQLFFEDKGIPTNLGYFDDDKVRSDTATIPYRPPHSSGWNDCIMRKAVRMVKPRKYKLLDVYLHSKGSQYNCQDWAEDTRRAYICIVNNIPYYPQDATFLRSKP